MANRGAENVSKIWYVRVAVGISLALTITASLFWATQSYLCGSWYNIFDELSCPTPIELIKHRRDQNAAESGEVEQVRALISSGLSPTEANELLFAAIYNNRTNTARLLIDNGARDTPRGSQPSALSIAAFSGNFEIVRLLLENGADPNGYLTPSQLKELRNRDIAVPDFDTGETPFYRAMDCLIQHDTNYITQYGGPLGCLRVATLLAKHGAAMAGAKLSM
jgi:FOG: Ankyrin repeat